MHDFTRRTLLQGATALTAARHADRPALLDFAKAWAQTAPWKAEKGAKLTVMRGNASYRRRTKRFNAIVAAFKAATGTEMNVFSESFEDIQPKASVAANTGQGLDLVWGLFTLPQLFPTKVVKMNDVADYLGKKYGGWTSAAELTCKRATTGSASPSRTVGGYMTTANPPWTRPASRNSRKTSRAFLKCARRSRRTIRRPALRLATPRATPTRGCTGCCGATAPIRSTRTTRSSSTRRRP